MQRKEAEKLLAALIFDDLDEASKTEILNYLQTDNELRERLADMRMAVKVASDTVRHGPDPVLGKRRLKRLASLARGHHTWTSIFTVPRLAAAAAIFIIGIVGLSVLLPGLQKASEKGIPLAASLKRVVAEEVTQSNERDVSWGRVIDAGTPSESESEQTSENTSTRRQFAFHPAVRGPEAVDMGAVAGLPERVTDLAFQDNRRNFTVDDFEVTSGAQTSSLQGYAYLPTKPGLTEKWDSAGSFEGKPPGGTASGEGLYLYNAPEAQSQVSAGGGTVMNNENYYAKNKIGGITDAQTSPLHGYRQWYTKPDSVEKLGSGSSFESKPRSGMREDGGDGSSYVGGDMGMGGYGRAGYGDKNGDGVMSYPYPGGGYAGMGGYGGMGGAYGGGMGGYGGGVYSYGGPGGKGGNGRYGGDKGVMSGDTLGVPGGTYAFEGDKDFGSKEINWFDISSDDPGSGKPEDRYRRIQDAIHTASDGDSIAVGGRVTLQDGKAVGIKIDESIIDNFEVLSKDAASSPFTVVAGKPITFTKSDDAGGEAVGGSEFYSVKAPSFELSGSTAVKESGLNSPIDSFNAYIDKDGDRKPVAIDAIKPVTITAPELTPPPPPARPSLTMKDVSGISELPDIKLRTESGESHVTAEDTKTHEWWAKTRAYDNEELAKKGYRLVPEPKIQPVKPPVTGSPGSGLVVEGSRQGEVSREADEAEIPYSVVTSSTGIEKNIADFLRSSDKTKSLLKKGQSTDDVSTAPVDGPADKEESRRRTVPILGDIPILGHLDSQKRPLTEEEEKQIIAHLEDRKSQPEGESVELGYETIKLKYANPQEVKNIIDCDFRDHFRDLPGMEDPAKVSIEALPQDRQIIVFGSKDQRETVKKVVKEIDNRPPQVRLDVKDVSNLVPVGEDEPDLPPASRFKLVPVNPWVMSERDSLSTFALDVDTASYTLCRRYIRGGFLPPAGAVRMEEFVNYFNYQYPQRTNPTFKVHAEAAPSPFARTDQNLTLLKIGVKARTIGRDQRKAAHLIFVVDASASMGQPDRLPLVQQALGLLVNRLSEVDRVSLITCANEARLHLETIPARERVRIRQAINAIQPAGSTNLLAGLKLGYATARRTFAPKQINHVVLCSDGVANVGQTEAEAVLEEVAADRKQGITITCVGVGYGSYNDAFMEALANQGDGSYMFLDSARQAHRAFVRQLAATLQTVARDARIQVDFNPNRVRRYRLIGYENRDIEDKRFRDDTIDAGEVGSGQCSTALYELELIGQPSADEQGDLGTVFVRYRDVETGQFEEISSRLDSAIVRRRTVESAPRFFLAAGAARFAEILRQSEHAQHGNLMDVFRVVEQVSLALPLDRDVRELAELIRKAENLPRSP